MGTKADHDLWGQALAIESRYGDRGLEVIARKVEDLCRAGQDSEAEFWSEVAECLTELHSIRWPGGISTVTPSAAGGDAPTPSRRRGGQASPRRYIGVR
ncbi:DUF6961 family protein [Sphingopyxis sp.]|uniref:DUF6961 family protein n=1 Tax=Sphingopyxis sp. TaxID=1908224 RepID=UPI0039C98806